MKRILWTGFAVAALAVPAGMASAQADDSGVEDDTTTVVCDGDQLRQQLHDGSGDQARSQQRAQDCEDCDQAMVQNRIREQVRVEDGTGDMVREQVRSQDGTGDMAREQVRSEDCDTCDGDQLREQLHDGSGDQVRSGGRGR